ncbi:MAG: DUF4258 domain-containing protein [Gemmataceae bacterium]|nr:DUF4258 domain-containing protein [Gemmataceae bacterium]
MDLRFFEDPETGQPHIYRHGVTEDEVREVLTHPGEDRPGADDSRVALGQTDGGRYLRVIYVPDEEGEGIFVVTAYPLQGKPLKAYRRRQRRRGK